MTGAVTLLPGLLAGAAVLAGWRGTAPASRSRARRVLRPPTPGPGRASPTRRGPHLGPVLVGVVAGVGVVLVVGGLVGVVAGGLAAFALPRWLRGLESVEVRRRRESLVADVPWAADLLAAAVEGGAPPDGALRSVADALGGPLGAELRSVAASLELGAAPALAWSGVDPAVGAVGRSFIRAAEHGTPAAEHIGRLADELRSAARAESTARLRAAGVQALAPLGACFLPAFVLLAVVPMVVGVAAGLLQ